MTRNVGIYVFPEVEVLDFAGPYEVFTTATRVAGKIDASAPAPFKVFTLARGQGTIKARAGLVVQPDHLISEHPHIDVLLVPGGVVTGELAVPWVAPWISGVAATAELTASICTGAFLLAQAGLLDGKRVTTHWEDVADLRAQFPALNVQDYCRWVDEGSIVTSAGISAGIDMSLHLVARLAGIDLARRTARQMDYDWREAA